jgi:hypothetical protein
MHGRRFVTSILPALVRPVGRAMGIPLLPNEYPLMDRRRYAERFSIFGCAGKFGVMAAADLLSGLDRTVVARNEALTKISVHTPA